METPELFRAAVGVFGQHVHAVAPDQWHAPTPCADWDVRELVNHVTAEDLWCVPLVAGSTIADVGDRFDGDVLGEDPVATWDAAATDAVAAVAAPGAMEVTTHLSFGDVHGREYTMQLYADHLIHGWDLARAIGADATLPSELVDALATWFADREELYRGAGAIGPKVELDEGASAQDRLLAAFGRTP